MFLNKINKKIGLDKIKVIHLNDSLTKLGSKVDRHCSIGEGYIGKEPFKLIMNDEHFKNIPKILEVPNRDSESKRNLEILRSFL